MEGRLTYPKPARFVDTVDAPPLSEAFFHLPIQGRYSLESWDEWEDTVKVRSGQ